MQLNDPKMKPKCIRKGLYTCDSSTTKITCPSKNHGIVNKRKKMNSNSRSANRNTYKNPSIITRLRKSSS